MLDSLRRSLQWKWNSLRLDQLGREHPLSYLFLEITRRCNLHCAYCGSECSAEVLKSELDADEWIGIARRLAEDFEPKKVMVAVTGGEPLLKPGVFELFNELHRLGFPFGMVSNGVLLDPECAARLVNSGIGSITLSLDGPPEVNDSLRGKGVAERVEAALGNLRAAGYQGKLEIFTTVTRPAVPYLGEMRDRVSKWRVPYWRLALAMPIGRASRRPDLVPGPDEFRAVLAFIRDSREDGLVPLPELGEEGYLGDEFEGKVRPYLCQCRAGITIAGILCDGKIGACPELGEAFIQGDIRRERFREVWENRYQVFRDRGWTKKGACAECEVYSRCRGGSLHLYPDPGQNFLRCCYQMLKPNQNS